MYIQILTILASAGLEMVGCALVVRGEPWPALVAHVIACALIASGLALASTYAEAASAQGQGPRTNGGADALAAAALAFALPLVGVISIGVAVLPTWRAAARRTPDAPTWPRTDVRRQRRPLSDASAGSIRQQLGPTRPEATRMNAVMALRRLSHADAVPLLRVALQDPSEDVRLLAYGILERREQRARKQLDRHRTMRSACTDRNSGVHLDRQLAADHLDLARAGFVSGRLEQETLRRARAHALAALQAEEHGSTLVLLARIALRMSDGQLAWAAASRARRQGVEPTVIAPLVAEAAFLRRRFTAVPAILRWVPSLTRDGELVAAKNFWQAQGASR